jgi:ribosome biogenesis protein ENP2
MHGYFLSLKLYDTARLIANPFAYEEHREKTVRAKIDALAESRIRTRKNAPGVKVNQALAERVQKDAERAALREQKRRERLADKQQDNGMGLDPEPARPPIGKAGLFADSRFSALFEDPEFEVDENSREFGLLNPSTAAQATRRRQDSDEDDELGQRRTAVEEEDEESNKASSDGIGASDTDDGSGDSSDAGGTLEILIARIDF